MARDPTDDNASAAEGELALNRQLEAEPHSVPLNIRKADERAKAGDDEVACYFYRRALQLAGEQVETAALQRAQAALTKAAERAHARRVARLTERGLPPQQWSPRLRASLEHAATGGLSRDPARLQDPTHFDYLGLPQVEYYDPARFDWAPAMEAATAVIREELLGLLAKQQDEFLPFNPTHEGLPLGVNKALREKQDWGVLAFVEQGWLKPWNIEQCPRTWETLLAHAPVPRVPGWGPSAIFSLLKAGAHIGAHTGMYNTRLICHLPLIVPPGCRFRVGNEVREWEEGKLLVFDDTIEHEAWNDSDQDRVMFIFDIWRPELSEQERRELTLLFSD